MTKLLKDLKELVEYDQSISTDRPIFLNDDEDHPVQNKESIENSSKENVVLKTNQEPPQDLDIHQLIEECSIEFLCIHDDIDDLIESALDSKLYSINSINSQHLDKKEQEVKNVEEQPAERGNHRIQSLQNFRVVHKKYETECDKPAKDESSLILTTFSNPLFDYDDNFDSSDEESLPDEDVPAEEFKIYSNSLFDEDEINSDNDDNDDDLSNDSLLEEVDLFLVFDNSIPPDIENVADDPEGDIRFLEELLIDDSILSYESFDANFEDNPLISRPPPQPPDVESFFDLKPDVIAKEISNKLNEDKCFDLGREINVSTKIEDDDHFPFMFVI
nr:hypothetical protein [Tanacetum cinerariifolium]